MLSNKTRRYNPKKNIMYSFNGFFKLHHFSLKNPSGIVRFQTQFTCCASPKPGHLLLRQYMSNQCYLSMFLIGGHACTHTKYINHNIYHTVLSLKGILVRTILSFHSFRDAGYLALFKCLCSVNCQIGSTITWFYQENVYCWRPGATCHAGERPVNWEKLSKDLHVQGVHDGYQNCLDL